MPLSVEAPIIVERKNITVRKQRRKKKIEEKKNRTGSFCSHVMGWQNE